MKPIAVAPHLPDLSLKNANWADAFEVTVAKTFNDARTVATLSFTSLPAWVYHLMAVRNRLAGWVGLKAANKEDKSSNNIGFFPVVEEVQNRIVMGFDDWHLDFRIFVEQQSTHEETTNQATLVRVTTLIKQNNIVGRIYLFLIKPFHKILVPLFLKQIK